MQKHVFFDLDSTLSQIEGLDYLATNLGLAPVLAEITRQAMNGEIPMKEAMTLKLNALKPSHADFVALAQIYLNNLTLGAETVLNKLKQQGYVTWLISGNFHPAAGIVAKHLGIAEERVLANRLMFDRRGEYKNFDSAQPLANNGGKAILIQQFTRPGDLIFMVGDGATDLETQGVVDLFIGFGGVVKRANIAKNAQIYVEYPDLTAVLPHILNYEEGKY